MATDRSRARGWPAGRAGRRSGSFPSSLLPLTGENRRSRLGRGEFILSQRDLSNNLHFKPKSPLLDNLGITLTDTGYTVKIDPPPKKIYSCKRSHSYLKSFLWVPAHTDTRRAKSQSNVFISIQVPHPVCSNLKWMKAMKNTFHIFICNYVRRISVTLLTAQSHRAWIGSELLTHQPGRSTHIHTWWK